MTMHAMWWKNGKRWDFTRDPPCEKLKCSGTHIYILLPPTCQRVVLEVHWGLQYLARHLPLFTMLWIAWMEVGVSFVKYYFRGLSKSSIKRSILYMFTAWPARNDGLLSNSSMKTALKSPYRQRSSLSTHCSYVPYTYVRTTIDWWRRHKKTVNLRACTCKWQKQRSYVGNNY